MRSIIGLGLLIPVLAMGAPTDVRADDTFCPPNLINTKVEGNVVVNNGTCLITGATVEGNVKVEPGGSLEVRAPTSIDGNIQSDGGEFVRIFGNGVNVEGNVQIKGATEEEGSGFIAGTVIGGNAQFEENSSLAVALGASIGGNLQLFKNVGGVVGLNTIGGNLQCKENEPTPTPFFGANVVGGNKEDQCAEDLGF